jgi:protein TonB
MHRALLVALLVETALVGAAIAWLTMRTVEPPPSPTQPMRLSLVDMPPAPPQPEIQKPPAIEPAPQPMPQVEAKRAPRPKAVAKPLPRVQPVVPPSAVPPDAPAAPVATAVATSAPEMPQAPPSTKANHDIAADYESKVRAAIQTALHFPVAAKALGREGRVRVSFDFVDGQTSNIRIAESGDLDAFDHAAEEAVRTASYPTPPAELLHQTLHLLIWVEFFKNR